VPTWCHAPQLIPPQKQNLLLLLEANKLGISGSAKRRNRSKRRVTSDKQQFEGFRVDFTIYKDISSEASQNTNACKVLVCEGLSDGRCERQVMVLLCGVQAGDHVVTLKADIFPNSQNCCMMTQA
jgi:hypothetical protein